MSISGTNEATKSVPFGAAVVATGDANANGTADTPARSDHVHKGVVANEAWTAWVPSWTNLTIGNGTVTATYQRLGRTIHFRLLVTFGSTTSISGLPQFTLPVTGNAGYFGEWTIGSGTLLDSGTASYVGAPQFVISNLAQAYVRSAASTGGWQNVTATIPFTWTTNDKFMLSGTYEAAS